MPVDRGARGDTRQRRALQYLSVAAGFIVGPGLDLIEDSNTLVVDLADGNSGLQLAPTGLSLLVPASSPLALTATGLSITLLTNGGLRVAPGVGGGELAVLLNANDSYLTLTGGLAVATRVPRLIKFTITHTELQAAALTKQVNLYLLPAGWMVLSCKIKHSVKFAGTGMAAYTVSVGTAGTPTKYAGAFDVFQAVGATVQQFSSTIGGESHTAGTQLVAQAVATGANTNASTAGSVSVWLLVVDAS